MAKKIPKNKILDVFSGYITQTGEDIAHHYKHIEEHKKLPYSDGIISLVHTEKRKATNFLFVEENMKPGMVPSHKGHRTLNLVDNKRKVLYSMTNSVYHFLAEDLGNIVSFLFKSKEYEGLELIIDISGIYETMTTKKSYDMYWFFLQTLMDKKIKHRIVNLFDFDIVYIDNFFLLQHQPFMPMNRIEDIQEYFLDYVSDKKIKPTKKVYLSRRKVGTVKDETLTLSDGTTKVVNPDRIDNEELLEKEFSSLGFDIVYPEDFNSFEEQINFFYSVKYLASVTSSGLTNAIFMQRGGALIEVITPLIARPIRADGIPGFLNAEFHNYYKNLAASHDLLYIGLPNPNGIAVEFIDYMERNDNARSIIRNLR